MSSCLVLGPRREIDHSNHTDSCKGVRHNGRLSTCRFHRTCYRRSAFTSSAGFLVGWYVECSLLLSVGIELHSYNVAEED